MSYRARRHKNGTTTVCGVRREDLREVLTAAAIHCHERRNDPKSTAYHKGLLTVIDALTEALKEEAPEGAPLATLSKEERWARLNRAKAERKLVDGIKAAMRKHVQEARAKKAARA